MIFIHVSATVFSLFKKISNDEYYNSDIRSYAEDHTKTRRWKRSQLHQADLDRIRKQTSLHIFGVVCGIGATLIDIGLPSYESSKRTSMIARKMR